jgi:ABC-type antimicrobial peptide transport system permease subunit
MIRKREIGMLRAVGLGNDEVGKMIVAEGLFYGISSAFWGTLLGYIITYLFFLLARKTLTNGMTWSISISNTLAIWAAVVLICFLAARHSTEKLFTSSIVEDIKVLD